MVARSRARFLAADIWDTPDDGKRYEVIDGELYVSPPPVPEHQFSAVEFVIWIGGYLREHPIGRVFTAPIGVVLDGQNGIQPDVLFLSNERLHLVTAKGIEGAPDLVIEVLSPSTRSRDYGVKLRRYEAAGVSQYWIADPVARCLEVRVLGPDGYGEPISYGDGDVFRPTLFPGLEIPIAGLWL